MDKKYQRADWKRRPLTPKQLEYARLDTHYLVALRDKQFDELTASGRWPEAQEEFERLARGRDDQDVVSTPCLAFWRVKGARDLSPQQAALLDALFTYRECEAERLDRPPGAMHQPCCAPLSRASRPHRSTPLGKRVSPRTCAIGTIACIPGARNAPAHAAWNLTSSCLVRRSTTSPVAPPGPITNWRRSKTSAPGDETPTGTRSWHSWRHPHHRRTPPDRRPRSSCDPYSVQEPDRRRPTG